MVVDVGIAPTWSAYETDAYLSRLINQKHIGVAYEYFPRLTRVTAEVINFMIRPHLYVL